MENSRCLPCYAFLSLAVGLVLLVRLLVMVEGLTGCGVLLRSAFCVVDGAWFKRFVWFYFLDFVEICFSETSPYIGDFAFQNGASADPRSNEVS